MTRLLLVLGLALCLFSWHAHAAIAFDAASDLGNNGGTTSSQSGSHTVTGSNAILLACFAGDNVNGGNDDILTVKYNNVSLTKVGNTGTGGGGTSSARYMYLYYLLSPATGSNTLAVTANSNHYILLGAASYTGVAQSGQPDAATNNNLANTSFSGSVTPVASNTWGVLCGQFPQTSGFGSLSSNATNRKNDAAFATWGIADSNGVLTAGTAWTVTFTSNVPNTSTGNMATWAPFVAGGAATPLRALIGVGQ